MTNQPVSSQACILVSAWSAGNSYCWVGARMIVAMTTDRQLPAFFGITNKYGTPYYAVVASFLFGPLAYLSLGSGGASQAFAWLQNLSTVAGLIAWATLCFAFIRFYKGCKVQGVDRDSFPWKGPFQPFTAWYGFVGSVIITLVSGFAVFLNGNWDTQDFVSFPCLLRDSNLWTDVERAPSRLRPISASPFSSRRSSSGSSSSAARSVQRACSRPVFTATDPFRCLLSLSAPAIWTCGPAASTRPSCRSRRSLPTLGSASSTGSSRGASRASFSFCLSLHGSNNRVSLPSLSHHTVRASVLDSPPHPHIDLSWVHALQRSCCLYH